MTEATQSGSTPQGPAPAAPALDLSHEPPAVAAAMQHPAFMNEKHPEHQDAVERVFALRQGQGVEPHVEGFASQGVLESDLAAPSSGDYATIQWPSGLSDKKVLAATTQAARDMQMGATELQEVMKAAQPYMGDNQRYTFAEGEAALRRDLGDKTDETLKLAKEYVQSFPGLEQWLRVRKLLNHPGAVKIFAARAQGRGTTQAEIDALMKDPSYFGGNDHKKSKELADRVFGLRQRMAG